MARAASSASATDWTKLCEMGPAINKHQFEISLSYIDIGLNEGAKLLGGGHRIDGGELPLRLVLRADRLRRCRAQMRIAQEEIFGPVVS